MRILAKFGWVVNLALGVAVICLAQGEESRENVLLTGLRSSDVAVRRAAARDLVQTEHRNLGRILPTLLLALKDPDPTVRFYTVVTLEAAAYSSESNAMALNAGVASLTQMLRDKESRVREAAARAISLVMPHPPQSAAIPLTGLL